MKVVLSLFSNFIDVLGRSFRESGYCVVSAGDIDSGQDIRDFHAPLSIFEGIIGGPPCQNFSTLNRNRKPEIGIEMLNEFCRVVKEAQPNWFLCENVPSVPDISVEGYHVQRFNLKASECGGDSHRNRTFQFGSKEGLLLDIRRDASPPIVHSLVTASEGKSQERRSFADVCRLQGIEEIELPRFHLHGKYETVGNSVHRFVGLKVAAAIREATGNPRTRRITDGNACTVCGAKISTNRKTCSDRCRTRLKVLRRDCTRSNEPRTDTENVSELAA